MYRFILLILHNLLNPVKQTSEIEFSKSYERLAPRSQRVLDFATW